MKAQVLTASRKDPHICMFCLTMAEAQLGPGIRFLLGGNLRAGRSSLEAALNSVVSLDEPQLVWQKASLE